MPTSEDSSSSKSSSKVAPKYLGMGVGEAVKPKPRRLNDSTSALPDTDTFALHVYFENPDQFEILSFVINGDKFTSYMFNTGSTLTDISVNMEHDHAKAEETFVIEQIKYVDGTAIKDVPFVGDNSLTVTFERADPQTVKIILPSHLYSDAVSQFLETYENPSLSDDVVFTVSAVSAGNVVQEAYRQLSDGYPVIFFTFADHIGDMALESTANFLDFNLEASLLDNFVPSAFEDCHFLDEEGSWSLLALPVYQNPMLIYGSMTTVPTLFGKSYMDQWHSVNEIIDDAKRLSGGGIKENPMLLATESPYDMMRLGLDDEGMRLFSRDGFLPFSGDLGREAFIGQAEKTCSLLFEEQGMLVDAGGYYASDLLLNDEVMMAAATLGSAGFLYNQGKDIFALPLLNDAGHWLGSTLGLSMLVPDDVLDAMDGREQYGYSRLLYDLTERLAFTGDYLSARKDVLSSDELAAQYDLYVPIYKQLLQWHKQGKGYGDLAIQWTSGVGANMVYDKINGYFRGVKGYDEKYLETVLDEIKAALDTKTQNGEE